MFHISRVRPQNKPLSLSLSLLNLYLLFQSMAGLQLYPWRSLALVIALVFSTLAPSFPRLRLPLLPTPSLSSCHAELHRIPDALLASFSLPFFFVCFFTSTILSLLLLSAVIHFFPPIRKSGLGSHSQIRFGGRGLCVHFLSFPPTPVTVGCMQV